MVIGFNKQFVEPILQGRKVHTIREDKHNRWKPGMLMHMATGVRTKQYNQFDLKQCQSVQHFEIRWRHKGKRSFVYVKIDGVKTYNMKLTHLALADGFESLDAFFDWFNKDFKGKIIHWTDLRY